MILHVQDSQHHTVDTTPVMPNGDAEIRGVGEGTYYVTVRNARGEIIHSDVLAINRHTESARISLPARTEPERPASGSISIRRLNHKVPKAAQKELKQAGKKLKSGDAAASVEQLKKAIEIDPEYMEAHNNLGSSYMRLDRYDAALESFRNAAELEPSLAEIQVNVAIALMALKEYPEAEVAARRAVGLNTGDMKARFILGLSLYQQSKFDQETANQLRRVEDVYPNVRIALAATYANMGDRAQAKRVLEAYLSSGQESKRDQAQAMLAALKQ